ncbi:hypothetical protein BT93_D1600 [Corymbia citriodora subsp. variegata]|nr:hypothetical protein BT93_D1600 [Corymbia citriodora subsp. variegata]
MRLLQLLFIACCASSWGMSDVAGDDDDPELERLVAVMNKRPNRTFVTEEGDIIDCVDIHKQPALDHPLLKNHKIQMNPNLYSTKFPRDTSSNVKSVRFDSREPCPIGTVPIVRVTKENLRRARSMPKISSIQAESLHHVSTSQHLVLLIDNKVANIKYGVVGCSSIFNLTVAGDQCSTHHTMIESGPPGHSSVIAAGWTGNGRDGCYNEFCRGFIQVDGKVTTKAKLIPTSVYGGPIHEVPIQIQQRLIGLFVTSFASDQERDSGNWWLTVADRINVGYWPKELFLNLQNGALHVAWAGDGFAGSNGVCPPMGSGYKPDGSDGDYIHSTYFRRINWVRDDGSILPPSSNTKEEVDQSNAYALRNHRDIGGSWGYTMSFGGPGGHCWG